jgi:hypothetical protein
MFVGHHWEHPATCWLKSISFASFGVLGLGGYLKRLINSRILWLRNCMYNCSMTLGSISTSSSLTLWLWAGIRDMYSSLTHVYLLLLQVVLDYIWKPPLIACISCYFYSKLYLTIYMKATPDCVYIMLLLLQVVLDYIYESHPRLRVRYFPNLLQLWSSSCDTNKWLSSRWILVNKI